MDDLRQICLRCPDVQPPPYSGRCACTIDGKDIIEHYQSKYCPVGRFRLGIGDWIARLFHLIGLRHAVALWEALTRKPCGCGKRANQLNGRFRGLHLWLLEWPAAFAGE